MAQLVINGRDAASTGVSLFFLDYGYNVEPLDIEALDCEATAVSAARSPKDRANNIIIKMQEATEMAQSELTTAQQQQEEYSNHSYLASPRYAVKSKHAKFTVLKAIRSHAYQLDMLLGVYNIFYVSLLRPAASDPFPSQVNNDYQPPLELVNGEAEYTVEEILKEREK
ncbi:hypothetical protein CNMCM5623_007171 [Aspergillus felis]|uniref:Uncharacterized protein n=1 Tax=Aspergillus felis TaxID=1287682 RepID=A0A8H6QK14_9EURO|nr:hypothetical protein CNMCM5623_007171 [Aspergillus felis]